MAAASSIRSPLFLFLWINVFGAWLGGGSVASEIGLGSRLRPTANEAWVSGNGTFAFGFTSSGEEDRYQLAIWFAQLPGDRTIVWSPNRSFFLVQAPIDP